MILTARYLLDQGYALWNYGMPLPYKAYLGGRIVNLRDFISMWRTYVNQTPQQGLAFEASPRCKETPTDYELMQALQDVYRFLYTDDIGQCLSDDFIYTDDFSCEPKSKTAYLDYLSNLVKKIGYYALRIKSLTTEIQLKGPGGSPRLLLLHENTEVALTCTIQNGKITAIHARERRLQ
jgi:hypothetical protein